MSEDSVIYAAIISGFGAIVIVLVKHWRASKCWTKNECCSCKLYREPASPDSTSLDSNSVTFKVDLDIKDDLSSIDEEHIPISTHKIEINEIGIPLENISQV